MSDGQSALAELVILDRSILGQYCEAPLRNRGCIKRSSTRASAMRSTPNGPATRRGAAIASMQESPVCWRDWCETIRAGHGGRRMPRRETSATATTLAAWPATKAAFATAARTAQALDEGCASERIRAIKQLLTRVVVTPRRLELVVREAALCGTSAKGELRHHVISLGVQLMKGDHATRLVVRDQNTETKSPDAGLVALLARANRWFAAVR